jgi:hypothetical protein
MLTLALLLLPVPLDLDSASIARARSLDGRLVVGSILVGKMPWLAADSTLVGTIDTADGITRTARLMGRRRDVEGKRVIVVGVLRVIDHSGGWIGQELVLPWSEIRVDESK